MSTLKNPIFRTTLAALVAGTMLTGCDQLTKKEADPASTQKAIDDAVAARMDAEKNKLIVEEHAALKVENADLKKKVEELTAELAKTKEELEAATAKVANKQVSATPSNATPTKKPTVATSESEHLKETKKELKKKVTGGSSF